MLNFNKKIKETRVCLPLPTSLPRRCFNHFQTSRKMLAYAKFILLSCLSSSKKSGNKHRSTKIKTSKLLDGNVTENGCLRADKNIADIPAGNGANVIADDDRTFLMVIVVIVTFGCHGNSQVGLSLQGPREQKMDTQKHVQPLFKQ